MRNAVRHVRCSGERLAAAWSTCASIGRGGRASVVQHQQCRHSHASTEVAPPYTRLSQFWIPTQPRHGKQNSQTGHDSKRGATEYANDLLVRAGFFRQTHAGIFHMLPLGARTLSKVEAMLHRRMELLGAAKTALSSISSESLWKKSGRLTGKDSELFHLEDRRETKLLLAPTHEEEITSIVASAVHSYKDLPLRLYQISRKYRDEARPRAGLLRAREFVMKDLYTFDATPEAALETYHQVRTAYRDMFSELKIRVLSAAADSGSIGGDLSHEYHLASASGEDTLLTCNECSESLNVEVSAGKTSCSHCESGFLNETKAIEIGHTFHLGDRYSKPLELQVRDKDNKLVNVQMGCHGVGVSRIVAAVADVKADDKGLNWPVIIAPFSIMVVPAKGAEGDALNVAEQLGGKLGEVSRKWNPTRPLDVALDDRDKPFGWKLGDADLIGYPVIVIVGQAYAKTKQVEVQCRQLNLKENVLLSTHNGTQRIYDILNQL